MSGLLTVAEVADYLKTTTTTVYRWLKEGKLTAVKIGKEWRIDEALLRSLLSRNENTAKIPGSFWRSFRDSEHIMLITNTNTEINEFEADFFQRGLAEGARLMKGCWWQDADEVVDEYSRLGLDAASLVKDGILSIVDLSRLYRAEGVDGPIRAWRSSIERAVSQGARRLWAAGSPSLNCCGKDSNIVMSFESGLSDAIKNSPVIGVCLYSLEDRSNRAHFDKMIALMNYHSGVAFYSEGQYNLLRH